VRANWKLQTEREQLLSDKAKLEQFLKAATDEKSQLTQRIEGFKGLLNDKNRVIEQKDAIINEHKERAAASSSNLAPTELDSSNSTVPIIDDTAQLVPLKDAIQFYQLVKESLTCVICSQYNTRPIVLGCCHVVCQSCFVRQDEAVGKRPTPQERRQGRVCPLCRYPIIGQGFQVLPLRQMACALRYLLLAFSFLFLVLVTDCLFALQPADDPPAIEG